MPEHDPQEDLALLVRAAEEGGRIALGYWRKDPESWEKPDGAGPVSVADLAVDRNLRRMLGSARPNYGWLSEETPDSPTRLAQRHVFIVDPIDGTRSFLAGEPNFAITLAITTSHEITAGVVHLPATGETYAALAGGIALKNGCPVHASGRLALAGADILMKRRNLTPDFWPHGVPAIRTSFRPSLAARLCLAAEGRHDGMLTLRGTWEWDCAAGSLIAERAGCIVTDSKGAPLCFNQPIPKASGLICGPKALHQALLMALRP